MFEVNTISSAEFKRRTLEILRRRTEEERVRTHYSKRLLGDRTEALEAEQTHFIERIDTALAGNLTLH